MEKEERQRPGQGQVEIEVAGRANLHPRTTQPGSTDWPEYWPGIRRSDRKSEEALWGGKTIPQPGQLMEPLHPERRDRLARAMPLIEARLSCDPELQPTLAKIREVMRCQPFVATQVWKQKQEDGGPSLQETQESTRTGRVHDDGAQAGGESDSPAERGERS